MCEDKFKFKYQRQKPKFLTETFLRLTDYCKVFNRMDNICDGKKVKIYDIGA